MADSQNKSYKPKQYQVNTIKEPNLNKEPLRPDTARPTTQNTSDEYILWAIGTDSTPRLTPNTRLTPNKRNVKQSIPASTRYLEAKKRKGLTPDNSEKETEENINPNQNTPDQIYDYSYLPHLALANASLEKETMVGTMNQLRPSKKPLRPTPGPKNSKYLQPKWTSNNQRVSVKFKMVNLNKGKLYQILHPHITNHTFAHYMDLPHSFTGRFQGDALVEMNTEKNEIIAHNIHPNDLPKFITFAKDLNILEPTPKYEVIPEEEMPIPEEAVYAEPEEEHDPVFTGIEVVEDLDKLSKLTQLIAGFGLGG